MTPFEFAIFEKFYSILSILKSFDLIPEMIIFLRSMFVKQRIFQTHDHDTYIGIPRLFHKLICEAVVLKHVVEGLLRVAAETHVDDFGERVVLELLQVCVPFQPVFVGSSELPLEFLVAYR